MSNLVGYTYDRFGVLIEGRGYSSPARARKLCKNPEVAGLALEEGGYPLAHYIGSTKSERWVAVNYDQFQAWRRKAGATAKESL